MHHAAFGLNHTETALSAIAPPSTPIDTALHTIDLPQSLTPRALCITDFCATNTDFPMTNTCSRSTNTEFRPTNTNIERTNTEFESTNTDNRPTVTVIATGVMVCRFPVLPAAQSVMPLPIAATLLRFFMRPWQTTEARST